MCFPSGAHTGFDGCLMSMSCSIVSDCARAVCGSRAPRTNVAAHIAAMTVVIAVIVFMPAVYPPANPNFRSQRKIVSDLGFRALRAPRCFVTVAPPTRRLRTWRRDTHEADSQLLRDPVRCDCGARGCAGADRE